MDSIRAGGMDGFGNVSSAVLGYVRDSAALLRDSAGPRAPFARDGLGAQEPHEHAGQARPSRGGRTPPASRRPVPPQERVPASRPRARPSTRGFISRRINSIALVTALLTSTFLALALSQNGSEPSSPDAAPTSAILSPFAILEPSTKNNPNDKDGYPPTSSEADPEEAFMLARVATDQDLYDATAILAAYPVDGVQDLKVDDDSPRSLDLLDGISDGKLAAGSYSLYWNLNKTGYVPVNTSAGSPYNGSNSASISIVNDVDAFQVNLTYRETPGGPLVTVSSDLYEVRMDKSASINQNDLSWLDTQPKVVFADVGETFTVRSKYQQSSAQGLHWMILQSFYNGNFLRISTVSLYFYNNEDPGGIVDGVPGGWDARWDDRQQFSGTDLGDTDNKDFWVTEYTFEVRALGFSDLIPYIQTKKGGDTWKIDGGYTGFQSHVPGGVNPAVLNITKYFSGSFPGGVVSGPDPPIVGETTTYALNITVKNVGADTATNVVVTDVVQLPDVAWLDEYTVTQGSLAFDPGTGAITWSVGTLAVNASATLSYQVSVTPDPSMVDECVPLNAGASVTGSSGTSGETIGAGPTPGLCTGPVTGVPDLTFSKSAGQTTADPGDQITYTLHYANVGSAAAYDVVVRDTIPDHVTYVSSSPIYSDVSGLTYSWNVGTVAAGAAGDVAITVQVDAGTPDGTVLANLGRVEYDDFGGEPQPPREDWWNVTVTAPGMTFSKVADVALADPGDLITYTLSYENTGTGMASDVVIHDTIPDHVTFISSTPAPSGVSGRTYTFTVGDVAGGGSGTVTIVVRVDAGTPDGTVLTNTATLDHDDANGNPYPQASDSASTTVTAPVVTFDKSVDVAFADPGDLITYTLTAYNGGTGYASGVVLKDTIPQHTTFYSASPGYDGVSGRTYTWNLGTLAPGQTKTVTLVVTVNPLTSDGTVLANTATLSYGDANGNAYPPLSDGASTTVTAPVMTFSKVADVALADPGDLITYTLTAYNAGTGAASGVVLKDTIPDHVTYVSSSPAYTSVSGRTYTWNLGTLAPGETKSVTLAVRVNASTPDGTVLGNTATLDYTDANGNPYAQLSDDATTTVTAPVMTFSKTADADTADPGDLITYSLAYHNGGTGWATDVIVADTLPDHVTFVTATPWYDSVSGRTYTWMVDDVGPGGGATITVTVQVDAGTADQTVLANAATLDHGDANGNPGPRLNDGAITTVTAPVLTFSKGADVAYADPGDFIVYSLAYHNGGTGAATGVTVTDTLPDHVTFVTASPWYSGVSGRAYTWDLGTVDPGASGTISVTVQVDVGTADRTFLVNAATLDYDDANGNPYAQLSDDATTTVTAPVMTFSKAADADTGTPGDTVTFTLTYRNAGSGTATLVVVEDLLPSHMTYVDATPGPDSISGQLLAWDLGIVTSGASGTITVEARIDVGTPDGTVLHNAATLDFADANGNPYAQLPASYDVTTLAPVMTFAKGADVTTADPGDAIAYTLHYANTGGGTATGVVVVDTLPAHVTFVGAVPSPGSMVGAVLTWDLGTVAAHTSGDIVVIVRVDVGTADGTFLVNAGTLDYRDLNDNAYPQKGDDAEVTVTAPILRMTKVADVTFADPGDLITYTIAYENLGSGVATGVLVSDTLPDDVTFVSASPSYDSVSGRTYTWDLGTVGAGASGTITIVVQVDAGTPDATLLHNAATLDFADANGNPYARLSDDADVTVTAPVVDVTKDADVDTADPGDLITYTVSFTNSGGGNATDVLVRDTIPLSVAFVSSVPDPAEVLGRTYAWYWALVLPGETVMVTIVVQVDAYTPDQTLLHNVATADYDDDSGNPYPTLVAYADVVVTAPVFSFDKRADVATADPGDIVTYFLEWENSGSGWASGVEIRDVLPEDVDFLFSQPPPTSVSGRLFVFALGDLPPGSTGHVLVMVKVRAYTPDGAILHNVAAMDFADANGNPYPQMGDYADVVVTAPVMSFSKTGDVDTADPGDVVTYALCYGNTGTGVAGGVVLTDTLPGGVAFVSSIPPADSQVGQTLVWNLGDVGTGGACVTVVVQVVPGTADRTLLHNAAALGYGDANGNPYPALSGYWDVRVTAPVFTFEKTANVDTADPGDAIMYTLTWANVGTGWASGVVIRDTLPDYVEIVSSIPSPTGVLGDTFVLVLGDVAPGADGRVVLLVRVRAGAPDQTVLHNVATLDYSDANGNFVERLEGSADVVVTAPVMTLEKDAGDVSVSAYVIADFTLRIAGEKWHDVRLTIHDGDRSWLLASITRYPGSPDDQAVTVYGVKIDLLGSYRAVIEYTPLDDPINGQWWGADPAWLTLTFADGSDVRLKHTFNVRHEDTWVWTIDDFTPYVKGQSITFEATIPYAIRYANVGTGDASGVVVTDLLPAGAVLLDANPPYDAVVGGIVTWTIGAVPAGGSGAVFLNVTIVFDVNGTVVVNEAALDYSDINGNFIERLTDFASSVLILPEIGGMPGGGAFGYGGGVGLSGVSDPTPGVPVPGTVSQACGPTDAESDGPVPAEEASRPGDGPTGEGAGTDGEPTVPGATAPESAGVQAEEAPTTGPGILSSGRELTRAGAVGGHVAADVGPMALSSILLLACAFAATGSLVKGRRED